MNFLVIYGRFRVSIYLSFERGSTGTRIIIIRNIKKISSPHGENVRLQVMMDTTVLGKLKTSVLTYETACFCLGILEDKG